MRFNSMHQNVVVMHPQEIASSANADVSNAISTECRQMKASCILILFNTRKMHHNTCKETTPIL